MNTKPPPNHGTYDEHKTHQNSIKMFQNFTQKKKEKRNRKLLSLEVRAASNSNLHDLTELRLEK